MLNLKLQDRGTLGGKDLDVAPRLVGSRGQTSSPR
jgi:hypothetical protein